MYPLNKTTIIEATWLYLDSSNELLEEDLDKYSYYNEHRTSQQLAEFLFYKMLASYKDNKHVQDMITMLGVDKVFEVSYLHDDRQCQVKYNDEFLDYRLDLKRHSPMGFGDGGSSFKQMTLAILSKASNDTEALRYYEDFIDDLKEILNKPILKNTYTVNQIDILHILAKKMFSNSVKRICKILGLKQKELAIELDVSDVSVNRWSSKATDIPSQISRIFDILEENKILKEKVEKVDLIVSTLNDLQK